MNDRPQLPKPEIIQQTANNWEQVCNQLDALNELLDRTNNAFEARILSNPVTAYRLRGVRLSRAESQPEN